MKHIFVGIDGTSNSAFYDKFRTNVYRMNLALDHKDRRGRPQLYIYSAGVGVSFNENFALLGKAFGQGIDEIILEAYVNLVSNYEPGDQIYIFGFSRGAIAARALSGLISHSGLLKTEYSVMIEEAWKYFVGEESDIPYGNIKRRMTHRDVKIRFLGVWDTVYGFEEKPPEEDRFTRLRMRNLKLDASVTTGVHVLSLDDSRRYFHPFLWEGVSHRRQNMEQIWSPGVHSDVGGGQERDFLSTLSLLTMIDRLREHCPDVKFDAAYVKEFVIGSLRKEHVIVNDEWRDYNAPGDQRWQRQVSEHADAMKQYVHPIVALLSGTDVELRGAPAKYYPTNVWFQSGFTLPLATFPKGSVYASLEPKLQRRLKPKPVPPKPRGGPRQAKAAQNTTSTTHGTSSTMRLIVRIFRLRLSRALSSEPT